MFGNTSGTFLVIVITLSTVVLINMTLVLVTGSIEESVIISTFSTVIGLGTFVTVG